jgi:hypothetical protein
MYGGDRLPAFPGSAPISSADRSAALSVLISLIAYESPDKPHRIGAPYQALESLEIGLIRVYCLEASRRAPLLTSYL